MSDRVPRAAPTSDGIVLLRLLRPSDLAAHAAGHDAEIVRWTNGGQISTDEQHLAWLARQAQAWLEHGNAVDLGVELIETGELAGVVGLQRGMDYLHDGQTNLTYAVYPAYRGRGLAARAVRLAMSLARGGWPVREFVIRCDPANVASAAVAASVGFERRGLAWEAEGLLEWDVLPVDRAPAEVVLPVDTAPGDLGGVRRPWRRAGGG